VGLKKCCIFAALLEKEIYEQELFTYSPTRYYYSLGKQAEVSLVCI